MPSISKITFNGNTLIDLTGDTVTAENLLYSVRAHMANGNVVTGQYTGDEPIVINVPMYDVGDIFMTTRSGNPSSLLGYGTWTQIKDRFLLAAGDNYSSGDTGGNTKHTHSYGLQYGGYYCSTVIENDSYAGVLSYDENGNTTIPTQTDIGGISTSVPSISGSITGNPYHYQSVGNTSYANNMPPYLTVYMWLRTA